MAAGTLQLLIAGLCLPHFKPGESGVDRESADEDLGEKHELQAWTSEVQVRIQNPVPRQHSSLALPAASVRLEWCPLGFPGIGCWQQQILQRSDVVLMS